MRLLRLRVQLDGVRSRVLRPGGARQGLPLRRRPARPGDGRAARRSTTTSTGSGTAPAATSATSAARRASTRATRSRSSAPSRCGSASTATWARKHAKWFVDSAKTTGWLRETELVPKTQGSSRRSRRRSSRSRSRSAARCRRRSRRTSPTDVQEARALYDIVKAQGRGGAAGIVQGERRSAGSRSTTRRSRPRPRAARTGPGSFPVPYLPELEKEGA